MKTLYLDCQMGAAGDMLSSALLGLAPSPDEALAELNGIGVPGVVYKRETVSKCGIASTRIAVLVNGEEEGAGHHTHHHGHHHHHAHRSLADVLHIIDGLSLDRRTRDNVARVYEAVAAAESRAHGQPAGEIHFHEVGAMDAIADIAAFCHLLQKIAPGEVVVSPVHVGCGSVACAHGMLSVPAPATAFLLEGVPSYSEGAPVGELCTPTGAALLKCFATSFGPQPLMRVEAIGYGAGAKDFERANVVRALLGERMHCAASDGTVCELEFNVDDMTGEELSYASNRIFAAGAKDVSFTPVLMKKGRPGTLATVICAPDDRPAVVSAIFTHTSTLGMRETACRRYTLDRKTETITLKDGSTIRRKIAQGYGVRKSKWEADDLTALAGRTGMSLSETKASLERSHPADGLRA